MEKDVNLDTINLGEDEDYVLSVCTSTTNKKTAFCIGVKSSLKTILIDLGIEDLIALELLAKKHIKLRMLAHGIDMDE